MPAVGSFLCFLFLLGGCRDEPVAGSAQTSAPSIATAPKPPPPPAPGAPDEPARPVDDDLPSPPEGDSEDEDQGDGECAPEGADLKPMQVLRFSFASGLEGKDPKDDMKVARPGQRVYAHLTMRNRSGRKRCLHLTFRVGGKKRTEVTLKVGESWSWRTWAYNTIKSDDTGPLELTIEDDQKNVVLKKTLPVVR
jgi:hypothetical protein